MPAKNEEIRKSIVKVLTKAKKPLSRAEIAAKMNEEPAALPLPAMTGEGTLRKIGDRSGATYELVKK